MQKKLVKMQQSVLSTEKENKTLKQTLKYLQGELVKTGKKMPLDGGQAAASGNAATQLSTQLGSQQGSPKPS